MSTSVKRRFSCLQEEIEGFYAEMRRCDYAEKSIDRYRVNFRALQACAEKHGIDAIGERLVRVFLEENGMDPDAGAVDLSSRKKWRRRVAMSLHHFVLHGEIPRLLPRRATYPGDWERVYVEFGKFCVTELELSTTTAANKCSFLTDFIQFMASRNILSPSGLSCENIKAYCTECLSRQDARSQKTRAHMASSARSFMKYLLRRENGAPEWESLVPRIKHAHVNTLPYIWNEEDINSLLNAVDRRSPIGKRDFALLTLASRTGMRNADIRSLRIDDICWDESTIRFFQQKTGNEQVLPLTDVIGSALIEYFRDGRPKTTWREVFVRHRPPFAPLSSLCIQRIVQQYCRDIGIRPISRRGIGLHAFRHTVASRMVNAGVEFETISGILGHASLDTTKQYARIDIEALRATALDPEEADHDQA